MLKKRILVALFHLLPLVPFAFGHVYAGLAFLLLVMMPYVKTKKLSLDLQRLREMAPSGYSSKVEKELDGVRLSRDRWRSMTWLSAQDAG